MILLIDNYDSFTYNLYQYFGELGKEIEVIRNDQITVEKIQQENPESIVLSPGPGKPLDAGICISLIQKCSGTIPILGICLGHQAIAEAFGGKVIHAPDLFHGKSSSIFHCKTRIFKQLPEPLEVGRYHSLLVENTSLPTCLKKTAWTKEGLIMAFEHEEHITQGIQFHPESVLTPHGKHILKNFLSLYC